MRRLILIFFIFFKLSVVSAQNKIEENIQKMFGEWTVLFREERRSVKDHQVIKQRTFEETAKVIFNNDGSMILMRLNKPDEKFIWKIKETYIKITHVGKGNFDLIEGEYYPIFSQDEKTMELRNPRSPHHKVYYRK